MYKSIISLTLAISCLLAEEIFAQPAIIQPPKNKSSATITPPAIPQVEVKSPDDFKAQVKAMDQQTADELSKKVAGLISPKTSANTQQNDANKPSYEPPASAQSKPTSPPSAPVAPSAEEYAPPFPSEEPASGSEAASSAAPSTATQPAQGYTGFGQGSTTGSSSGSTNSQSSGGWNIKY